MEAAPAVTSFPWRVFQKRGRPCGVPSRLHARYRPGGCWGSAGSYRSAAPGTAHGHRARNLPAGFPLRAGRGSAQSTWADIVEAANRHNEPGRFTTFIGYEWSSAPEQQNLHRNVIFKGDKAPIAPFSRFLSSDPEDLWRWMDVLREQGLESLAIPHNANGSNGQMFSLVDFGGNALDADYAERRVRNEPLVKITQVKGTSETHPALSPNDEWADFEIMPYLVSTTNVGEVKGSYVREAWLNGLRLSEQQGFDPFGFGVIGSSDSHNGSSGGFEEDFWGKIGVVDGTGKQRGSVPLSSDDNFEVDGAVITWGSSGLAGVWAEQNTRESLYEAMRRKETFGTSGTRIKVRFFAGHDLPSIDSEQLISEAYAGGVPMGADLVAEADREPSFIVWALRDALSAPLQRVQIIKGWIDEGEVRERVFDVACSDGGVVDPVMHRCPGSNAKVNLADCSRRAGTVRYRAQGRRTVLSAAVRHRANAEREYYGQRRQHRGFRPAAMSLDRP